ncbi:hypothetical protein AQUCO_01300123v1 [Aquilegia coerulea]|uniref:GYF domain-containing protein n=1 Tax=Aquilegia coerulea TaxID=218851 RepID=A0A2G5DZV8_AQUCA|nr:hypothetical protein AQUCO_01300123v1 [Aquilegia coerulea]
MDGELDIKTPCPLVGKEMLLGPKKYTKKAKPKKREFNGWGSKSLRDFLKYIDKDSETQLSHYEVHDIIKKYIMQKKLTDPQKKRKVLCDSYLQAIFGRKSVMLNKTYDLLERHFADNMEDSEEDELNYNSDEKDDDTATMSHKRQRRTGLSRTVEEEKVLETPRSCFASVIAHNIKLVYLKRSLVEDLLKNPETFDDKVMRSFVRVRSDPHDYLQKNAYQLLQVTGISKAQGTDNISKEVTLHVSYMKKEFHICMLSDEDFLEEEIVDLRQRVKDGMFDRLTIVELEQKARILHEDITVHGIKRELVLLQKLIDRANEKGWRKELGEYFERKELLQTPSEKQRLLREVPKVIAEEIEVELTPMGLPEDEGTRMEISPQIILPPSKSSTAADIAGVRDAISANFDIEDMPDRSAIEVNGDDTDMKAPEKIVEGTGAALAVSKPGEIENEDSTNVSSLVARLDGDQDGMMDTVDDSAAEKETEGNGEAVMKDSELYEIGEHLPIQVKVESSTEIQVVVDENEENQGTLNRQSSNSELIDLDDDDDENPYSEIWQYTDPKGETRGPFPMSELRRWWDNGFFNSEFKVWKAGESKAEAIFLEDALSRIFPEYRKRKRDSF